jgi:sodium pump decarboxylase gamma subunit
MLDKFLFGIYVTIICMSIVFLVLIGLSFVIRIQRSIVEKLERSGEHKDNALASEKQSLDASVAQEQSDDEFIAVISAAVAAALERPASEVVVRPIRKHEFQIPSWASAGLQQQMNTRF